MGNIVLCPNPLRDSGSVMTEKVAKLLSASGIELHIEPLFRAGSAAAPDSLGNVLKDAEMLITFGGDGTILHAARQAARVGVPVLGVNMGRKGFIAELEQDEVELILRAAKGDYSIETRMMLDYQLLRGGKVISENCALNDVVASGVGLVLLGPMGR